MVRTSLEEKLFLFFMMSTILFQYPCSLNIFSPFFFNLIVMILFIILFIYSYKYRIYNKNILQLKNKFLIFFIVTWCIYFLSLTIGTLLSENVSFYYLFSYGSKMIVFLFFIFYLDDLIIKIFLKIYSYFALLIVLISIAVGILVAMNLLTSNETANYMLPNYLKFYGIVFYAQSSPLDFFDFPLYRLQGLSIEAGIFSIFLFLPTLYFLIVEKSYLKFFIMFFALIWTYSFPAFVMLLIVITGMIIKKYDTKTIYILSFAIALFVTIITITNILEKNRIAEKHRLQYNKEITLNNQTFIDLRSRSGGERVNAVSNAINYIQNLDTKQKLFGLGAANSTFIYGKLIANGYLFKLLDSGILGFIFYGISAFSLLLYSIKCFFAFNKNEIDNDLAFILLFTTSFLVLVSTLRQSFDTSYFQMFMYASLFILVINKEKRT